MPAARFSRFLSRILQHKFFLPTRQLTLVLPTVKPALQPAPVKAAISRPRSGFIL